MVFNKVKRQIGIAINKSFLRPLMEKCNLLLFHWQDRLMFTHPCNGDTALLVIRPQTNTQGLLSSYLYVLKYVKWGQENGWVSYVDFTNGKCQYYTGRTIRGSKNAWEYYFEQPSQLTESDMRRAGTIVFSGWSFSKNRGPKPIPKRPESANDVSVNTIAKTLLPVKKYILDIVEEKYRELFNGKVLGVFIRGTDYIRMKPKGHARQPEIGDVIKKIDEFVGKYKVDKIFVVTEDQSYFSQLQSRFGDKVFASDNYFIDDYSGTKYVGESFTNDAYTRGLNYLIRILLFGKCDYTIAGITNGSVVANLLKNRVPLDAYWFDLGLY